MGQLSLEWLRYSFRDVQTLSGGDGAGVSSVTLKRATPLPFWVPTWSLLFSDALGIGTRPRSAEWAKRLVCSYPEDSAGTRGCRASENVGSSALGPLKGLGCSGRSRVA